MADVRQVYADELLTIEIVPALGPMENNSYIIRPNEGGPVVVVDAPEGSEAVVEALGEALVSRVILTHSHRDHWGGHEPLRERAQAPFCAGLREANLEAVEQGGPLERLEDGALLDVGMAQIRVVHTPGHTPGSLCLVVGDAAITGDTLFPGGPGYSRDHAALEQEIQSITQRLYSLPDETLVLPGHGDGTTIGASKAEYGVFASKQHADDLHGDVLWGES